MLPMSMTDQASMLITICFSFLIFSFSLIMIKERGLLKAIGFSFFVPLFLSFYILFAPGINSIIKDADFFLLVILFLLILIWRLKLNYYLGIMATLILPIIVILVGEYKPAIFGSLFSPYSQAVSVILFTLFIIISLRKSKSHTDATLIWGVSLLGAGQAMQVIISEDMVSGVLAVKLLVYVLLASYVIGKTRTSLLAKVTDAETKLANLNRTINLEVRKKMISIEQHNEHLQNMVMTDSLTNAYNKKFILNTMEKLIEAPGKGYFSIMMFDLDHFKKLNDTQGHIAGDMVLKRIASIARSSIRTQDILGRYGGDEFVIILPGVTTSETMFVAERFRKKVEEADLDVSVSIGVSSYPQDGSTVEQLLETADAGLYHSKNLGRNTVSHYPQVI